MRFVFPFTLIFCILLTGCRQNLHTPDDNPPVNSNNNIKVIYSIPELREIINSQGYSVEESTDKQIAFRANGHIIQLYKLEDGDLLLSFGFKKNNNISFKEMNEWNKEYRLSRGFIDDEGDPIVETDLMTNGGISKKNITEFIKVFTNVTVPKFIRKYGM
ncbi:YbjN domain-containing protein [Edwardsiella hoshinae]|uniref:Lipoprotein n=1 Tax=Edwardsiella hoshinae TaxID=93378 RepID=A0A376DLJ4_9GAMM|nr:YbjN domain-containing protein [Edwardsiella hoshinae]QPR29426.1 YbjN domain-containing protein [Edwardsiella hoshinae]STC90527.1 Uncharacterised protein [Edwardsiella hoshinae]